MVKICFIKKAMPHSLKKKKKVTVYSNSKSEFLFVFILGVDYVW